MTSLETLSEVMDDRRRPRVVARSRELGPHRHDRGLDLGWVAGANRSAVGGSGVCFSDD